MLACAPTSLVVLWDFSCSVKSAAAPMARPSTAVIQTFMLLGLKSCPEFVLAGSSSRSHRDYLFICHRSEHGGLLSAGDPTTTTLLIWASVLRVQVERGRCTPVLQGGCIIEVWSGGWMISERFMTRLDLLLEGLELKNFLMSHQSSGNSVHTLNGLGAPLETVGLFN